MGAAWVFASKGTGSARSVQSRGTVKVPAPLPLRITLSLIATRRVLRMRKLWPRSGWNGWVILVHPKSPLHASALRTNREQFEWQNDIDYRWGNNDRNRLTLHLMHCQESWQELDESGTLVERSSCWAWVGDAPFCTESVHARCNLGGRHRWSIEEGILVEKHQGYQYEHLYAENWNAMRGYHYLMRVGHALNVLSQFLSSLVVFVKEKGPQGFIAWVRETLSGCWLKTGTLRAQLSGSFQLRLLMPLPTAGP